MAESYTIMKRRRDPPSGYRTKSLGPQPERGDTITLSVETLDDRQAAEARQNPDLTIARGYRTRLIKPLDIGAEGGTPGWGLDAIGATATDLTGDGVVVAVLDTGIDRDHEAFRAVDLVEQDFSGTKDGDGNGHGTHCAGTIFGGDVGGVRIGVAPGVRRALIGKILDDSGGGDAGMMFKGIRWALAQGADVISLSIGFDFPGEVAQRVAAGWEAELATSEALDGFRDNLDLLNALIAEMTANKAFGTSPLVVAAAGNESKRGRNPDWRISASLPAAAVHLSVAAVGPDGAGFKVAPFSNSKPRVAAPGVGIISAKAGGGLISESGTSMACPFVSGVAALWAQKLREGGDEVVARSLESHIVANASRKSVSAADVVDVGHGLVTAPQR